MRSRPVFDKFGLRLLGVILVLGLLLAGSLLLGLATGSSRASLADGWQALWGGGSSTMATIIWQIRLPRVLLAATVGATLALGGLVFQALLRNPLAEPYILGVSGGSAIGAISGMLLGFSSFPGVTLASFSGSMAVLAVVLLLTGSSRRLRASISKDGLLLGGVMMNAFCGAVIMFLISISRHTEMQQILFWLMGDFSLMTRERLPLLLLAVPCFLLIAIHARPMNLLLLGAEAAAGMGVAVSRTIVLLLVATTFMVSVVVSQAGLIGFVGLVVPHVFRVLLGPDHRLLVPASLLGGASYLIVCDLLARLLPAAGEMPVGILTALIGAPLFIFLLWRAKK